MKILGTQTFATIRYFVINGIFAACIYYGFYENVEWAKNIGLFVALIVGIIGVLGAIGFMLNEEQMNEQLAKTLNGKFFGAPQWFDMLFDIAVVFVFVTNGHIFLSILYMVQIYTSFKIRVAPAAHTFDSLKG